MRRRENIGVYPIVCSECGCPGVMNKPNVRPEDERRIWACNFVDELREEIRILNAVIDDIMPHDENEDDEE